MRSMAQKQRRGKECQAGRDQVKQRKAKVYKRQTLAARRRADRARREQQRPRGQRDEKARRQFRLHSSLGWQAPVTRYAGRLVAVRGLAGSLGLEPLAADPPWRPTAWDPPVEITPLTALASRALASLHERSTCG